MAEQHKRADTKYNSDEALTARGGKFFTLDQSGTKITANQPESMKTKFATEKIDKNQSVTSSLDKDVGDRGMMRTGEGDSQSRPGRWIEGQGYADTTSWKKMDEQQRTTVVENLRPSTHGSIPPSSSRVNEIYTPPPPNMEPTGPEPTQARNKSLEPLPKSGSDAASDKFGLYSADDIKKSGRLPGEHNVTGISKAD